MKQAKNDVSINIKSIQVLDGERDITEFFTRGWLSFPLEHKNASDTDYILSYEESEATGYKGNKVDLTVTSSGTVTMRRSGDSPSNLIIEPRKKHHCHYGTPYGNFMVGINTDAVRHTLNENKANNSYKGNLYFKYTIDVNSSLVSENEMHIDFKSVLT